MENISTAAFAKLEDNFKQLLEQAPEQRAELHQSIGQKIKEQLDIQISNTINDKNEHVRSWQVVRVGSHGGYVAVRPIDSKDGATAGPNGQAAITHYLSSGHSIRKPADNSKGYKSRSHMLLVKGRNFYPDTAAKAEQIATIEAERWAKELSKKITEGL